MKPASHWASKPAPPSDVGATKRRIVEEVLGDGQLPWLAGLDLVVDPGHERPSVGQGSDGIERLAVDRPDEQGRVEPKAVAAELLEPGQGAVAQERAHLATAVVGPGGAPRRLGAAVVVEVDAAAVVLAPAVEPPQVQVRRTEVVEDDIHDDRDAVLVGRLDEALERVGSAIARLDGEEVRRVVTPRDVAGELERRHDLDRTDAQVAQVRQPADGAVEVASRLASAGERADVQLVDDDVVPARHREAVVAPVERIRVVDDRVADRVGDLSRVRVEPRLVALGGADRKRYSTPGSTPGTSADHVSLAPSSSRARTFAVPAQPSKVPLTKTDSACGAQTRNEVPSRWGRAPMPGRGEGATDVTWRAASDRGRWPVRSSRRARRRRRRRPSGSCRSPSWSGLPSA